MTTMKDFYEGIDIRYSHALKNWDRNNFWSSVDSRSEVLYNMILSTKDTICDSWMKYLIPVIETGVV